MMVRTVFTQITAILRQYRGYLILSGISLIIIGSLVSLYTSEKDDNAELRGKLQVQSRVLADTVELKNSVESDKIHLEQELHKAEQDNAQLQNNIATEQKRINKLSKQVLDLAKRVQEIKQRHVTLLK